MSPNKIADATPITIVASPSPVSPCIIHNAETNWREIMRRERRRHEISEKALGNPACANINARSSIAIIHRPNARNLRGHHIKLASIANITLQKMEKKV